MWSKVHSVSKDAFLRREPWGKVHPAHLDAGETNTVLFIYLFRVFFGSAGELEQALLLPQCLFDAHESVEPHGSLTDETHKHTRTQCIGTDDDARPRCVEEPPQQYTMPGERSDSGWHSGTARPRRVRSAPSAPQLRLCYRNRAAMQLQQRRETPEKDSLALSVCLLLRCRVFVWIALWFK